MPVWWNGRHGGFKILCPYGRAGSTPVTGMSLRGQFGKAARFRAERFCGFDPHRGHMDILEKVWHTCQEQMGRKMVERVDKCLWYFNLHGSRISQIQFCPYCGQDLYNQTDEEFSK